MRILAVAPYYEPEGGGLERYAHHVLSRLSQRGHEVTAFSFSHQPHLRMKDGVVVERFAPMFRLGNAPVHPSFRSRLRKAMREQRPDVVVGHTPVPFAAEMAYSAARKEGIPFVLTYHAGRLGGSNAMLDGLASVHRATFERRMIAGSHRLIAVSPYVRDVALRRHAQRADVVAPGVDHARFRTSNGWPREPGILFVGPLDRSYRWKGVDVLWEAFASVRQAIPAATLTLVGGGDRLEEFRRKAAAFPEGTVRVPGRLDDAALVRAYQEAMVAVLPSTSDAESFGMVLAEANACGTPVVGSDVGGIPSFITHGENGLLARPGDAQDLAVQLGIILGDPKRAQQMGRQGREKVLRDHDWDQVAQRTEQILRQAVALRA